MEACQQAGEKVQLLQKPVESQAKQQRKIRQNAVHSWSKALIF